MSLTLDPEWERLALKFPRPSDVSDEEYIERLTVTPLGRLLIARGISPQLAITEADTSGRSGAIQSVSDHIESASSIARRPLASVPVGAELIGKLHAFVRRFVVLSETQATV